jgi:tRNA U34 2-thiouridine synthase MnmA/TrmU
VGKDVKKNILIVSENKNLSLKSLAQAGRAEQIKFSAENYLCFSGTGFCLSLENINWINKVPEVNKKYTMQIRYHGDFLPCKVKIISKIEVEVIYTKSILVASGQSCVIYDKDVCLGGGIVK